MLNVFYLNDYITDSGTEKKTKYITAGVKTIQIIAYN